MIKNKQKLVYASSVSAILSVLYVVVVTIWAEKSPALKTWLTDFSGHHWTSKSIISLGIYFFGLIAFYLLPKQIEAGVVKRYLKALIIITALGALTLLAFFTGHNFGWF